MATRMFNFLKVSRNFHQLLRKCTIDSMKNRSHTAVKAGVIMSGLFTGLSKEKSPEKRPVLEEPDASKLSREYLMKSAGIVTTEQACILLTQAALALTEARTEYSEAMFALSVMMEYKLKVLGNTAEEARIWDLILEARDLVSLARQKKQTYEMVVNNARNMVNAGAEVAYITGSELVGNTSGDHLNKVDLYLRQSEEECQRAELKLRDTEVKCVEAEGKFAKENEERLAAEAAETQAAQELEFEGDKAPEGGHSESDADQNELIDNAESFKSEEGEET